MAPVGEDGVCPKCGKTAAGYEPQPSHLQPGTVLRDRYVIGGVLGEGGFGITYIGLDRRLEMRVAIKEYYPRDKASRDATASVAVTGPIGPQAQSYEKGKQRFLREAKVMAKMVKQPAIVTVRDFFEANNTAYIVMEYVDGVTLKEMTEQRGHIPPGELLPMVEPLFGALATLHEAGLIHRDISPDNIMVEHGHIRLLDFGCAREAEGSETLTVTLKQGFAPIEQYGRGGQGPWTDVYALSATIYYCLTGVVPPRASDRAVEDTLMLPIKLGAAITETEEKALLRGMSVLPRGRFQSVRELYDALYNGVFPAKKVPKEPVPKPEPGPEPIIPKPIPEPEPIVSEPEPKPMPKPEPKPRKKTGAVVAAVLALAVIAAAVFWFSRGGLASLRPTPTPEPTAEPTPTPEPTPEPTPPPTPAPGRGQPLDLGAYEDIHTLPAGSYTAADVEDLMNDDSVGVVALADGAVLDLNGEGEYTLTKPLLVGEGAALRASWLRISGDGALQVDGQLDCQGLVTLEGEETKLSISKTGGLPEESERCAVFLMDSGEAMSVADTNLRRHLGGHMQIMPRRPEDILSVTTLDQLLEALEDEKVTAISVDGDITATEGLAISSGKTVWVSEGVTLNVTSENEGGGYINMIDPDTLFEHPNLPGAVLVNEGTVNSCICIEGRSAIYNYGVMSDPASESVSWGVGMSLVLNFGQIRYQRSFDLSENSFLLNAGEIGLADCFLTDADMVNLGQVTVGGLAGWHRLETFHGAGIYNSGTFTVEDTSSVTVHGWMVNRGTVDVKDGGFLRGSVYNDFSGRCYVEGGSSGLICGPGTAEKGREDVNMSFYPNLTDGSVPANAVEVHDEASLRQAEQAGMTVLLRDDLTVSEPLTLTAPVYVAGRLKASALTVYRTQLTLCEGGSLEAEALAAVNDTGDMAETAWLILTKGAGLTVTGSMGMTGAALYAGGGAVDLSGAILDIAYDSAFALRKLEGLSMDRTRLRLATGSIFTTPGDMTFSASGLVMTVEDGEFWAFGPVELAGSSITDRSTWEDSAGLVFTGDRLAFDSCAITLEGTNCGLWSQFADVELNGNTQIVNNGQMNFDGWGAYHMTGDAEASFVNNGTIFFSMEADLVQPVDNRGSFFYNYPDFDPSVVKGIPAEYREF